MGVFSGGLNEAISGSQRLCKRDYEADIEAIKNKELMASRFLQAVEDYCDTNYSDGNATFTLNGLIGGLTREIKQLNKTKDTLIAEWEKEKS
jgi:hypothetical protein